MTKRVLAMLLTLAFMFSASMGIIDRVVYAVESENERIAEKKALTQVHDFSGRDRVTIMVELDGAAGLAQSDNNIKSASAYADVLLNEQVKAKKSIEAVLKQEIEIKNNYTLLFNGFAFDGTADMLNELNETDGITAFIAPQYELPKTIASNEITEATAAWELGYTGEGMTIAIIDTGIYAEHEAFSKMPPKAKIDRDYLEDIYDEYGEYMHSGSKANMLYESAKIPFAYDYFLNRYGAQHSTETDYHGTHVAGIAAGNNGDDFRGIAYDAQIAAMQVFDPATGYASWDSILAALEDCAYLGVDGINMSLGSPAGFSAYSDEATARVYSMLAELGVSITASAGNETSSALGNAWDGYQLAANPDSGIVGSPSTWGACMSVASSDNATVCSGYIQVADEKFGYNDPYEGTELAFNTLDGKYEYVMCESGTVEDMEGLDLDGKIAVICRGKITFTEKAANAKAAGAVAAVIYNNTEGAFGMSIESEIPAVSILMKNGEKLAYEASNNVGELTVKSELYIDYSSANIVSSFSSIGSTADLKIKPEIIAPGGSITSAVQSSDTSTYETLSGTSMASPQVAGGMTLIMQYVDEQFPNKSDKEKLELANAILMSTATPLENELVREQGAGLINLLSATTTNAYLSVEDCTRPKLELGEIAGDTFELEFKVHNFGDKPITYEVKPIVYLDMPYASEAYDQTVYVTAFDALDVTEDCTVTASDEITVRAGKTATVKVEIKLKSSLMDDIHEIYTAGAFIEGFVKLIPENSSEGVKEAELSVPYLGFLGDWDYAAVIDYAYYWQNATGEPNWYSNPSLPFNYVGYSWDVNEYLYGAGINPYCDGTMPRDSFSYDRIAVSPGKNEIDYIAFSLLRNIKNLNLHLENDKGENLGYLYECEEDYMWRKEYLSREYTYSDLSFNIDYSAYEENETIHLVLEAFLDHEGFNADKNQNAVWDIPITIDSIAPFITDTQYKNNMLTVKALDTNYIAAIKVYSDEAMSELMCEKLFYSDMRASEESFKFELNKDSNTFAYISLLDYAGNERVYVFNTRTGSAEELIDPNDYAPEVVLWSDSFEDSTTYAGWATKDYDGDGNEWFIAEESTLASDGKRFMASESYDSSTDTGIMPDNVIFSPYVEIPNDDYTYTIRFDIAAADYDEVFAFYVSDVDSDNLDSAYEMYYAKISGSRYNTIEIDVTEFAGETVRFAWRHFDCSDGNFIRLDNIKLYYLDAFDGVDPMYYEDFESGINDWNTYDEDGDGRSFSVIKNEALASEGESAIFSRAFDSDDFSAIEVDNWIVSDAIRLPKEPSLSFLRYDETSLGSGDYYELYISESDDTDDMDKPIYVGVAGKTWSTRIINLSAFAGETIHISFRHISDDKHSGFMLGIDNVEIAEIEREAEYMVTFKSAYTDEIIGLARYEKGTVITGFPKAPEYDNFTFIKWDYDGKPINKDMTIRAEYKCRGDVNGDEVLNTGDASALLRMIAYGEELDEIEKRIADYNRDGVVNTGDATSILRHMAGLD